MRVAICDDDKVSCGRLRRLILEQEPGCEVICFHAGKQFLESKQHFDILLLDIQMEDMSGIELARTLRINRENTILIFVTALKEYAAEAFEVSAFHYILKPVAPEKFCRVFENACREVRKQAALGGEQLFFHTKLKSFTVLKNEILYVESKKRKVDVHTLNECFTVYATMKHMEERLGSNFYRCHRGYLVNLAYVTEYGPGTVRLSNGAIVYMAREKYAEFVRAYTQYLEREGICRV